MKDVRLAICLPLVDAYVYKGFFLSWMMVEKPSSYHLVVPQINPGSIPESLSETRNALVERALEDGCTHIIMMDTDQIYPRNTITKLLSHDLDVVAAKVHRRYPPFDPILLRGKDYLFQHVPDEEWQNQELVEVDAVGTGCIMYKSEVFKSITKPWYKVLPPTDTKGVVGEDIYCCAKIREAGYRIFVDTTINVGHLALLEINTNFYDLVKLVYVNHNKLSNPR